MGPDRTAIRDQPQIGVAGRRCELPQHQRVERETGLTLELTQQHRPFVKRDTASLHHTAGRHSEFGVAASALERCGRPQRRIFGGYIGRLAATGAKWAIGPPDCLEISPCIRLGLQNQIVLRGCHLPFLPGPCQICKLGRGLSRGSSSVRAACLAEIATIGDITRMNEIFQPGGAVDLIGDCFVRGWAFDPLDANKRLRTVLLLDGDIAGFAVADQAREDLVARGIGDGAHGFSCHVPDRKLQDAGLLTVLVETSMGFVVAAERRLRVPPMRPDSQRSLAIHFDITDLLVYIFHHREVSGIQRVLCGYLVNALGSPEDLFSVRVCTQPKGLHAYVEIDRDSCLSLLAAIVARRPMSLERWRETILELGLESGALADFQRGDMLLTLGAPWVCPDFYAAVITARRVHGIHYVQLVYDLIPTLMPEMMAPADVTRFNRSMAAMFACADLVLTISQHTKQDVLQVTADLAMPCPPVFIVPLGADIIAREVISSPRGMLPLQLESGDFVLCVGTLEPRKNHTVLFEIWKRMLAEGRNVPRLVWVGRFAQTMDDLQRRLQVTGYLDDHIVHLTDISDASLALLYRRCLFTVFPSLCEGWGLPVAESLLFGKLCVASNASSMPEVGGEWAIYFDPHDVDDGYHKITALLDDRPRIAALEQVLRDGYQPTTWRAATYDLMGVLAAAQAAMPDPVGNDTESGDPEPRPVLTLNRLHVFSSDVSSDETAGVIADRVAGPVAQLGVEIARLATSRLLVGADWHEMEAWGAWSCGVAARLGFTLPSGTAGPLVCYLQFQLPHYAPKLQCSVMLNDVEVGSVRLEGDQQYRLLIELPAALGPTVSLTLQIDRLLTPPIDMPDQRLLGIGLMTLFVCAADDRAARLAYFSDRMITPKPVGSRRLQGGGW